MTGIETGLLIQLGLILTGAILRGHAPKVWGFLAPLFGAAQQVGVATVQAAATPTPTATGPTPPPPPPTQGAPVPAEPSGPTGPAVAELPHAIPLTEEDALEHVLASYVSRRQQHRRIAMLIEQAQREHQKTEPKNFPPQPSPN